jgi:lysophospholipase L1-like esterase
MRTRTRTRLLVLLAGSAVSLGLAEVAVRMIRPPLYLQPPQAAWDPWRGRAHRPSAIEGLDYEMCPKVSLVQNDVAVETNARGLRGPAVADVKPAGTLRIAAVGDSLTFGLAVPEALTWPRRVEAELRAARPELPIEVLNFGVCGYSITDEVVAFEAKGLPLDPDVVILGYCLNDPERAPTNGLQRQFSTVRAWHHSSLLRLVASTLRARGIASNGDLIHWLHAPGGESWTAANAAFDRLRALCAARSIPVLVAVYPMFDRLQHWSDYPWADVHERVLDASRARGFGALDLLPTFVAAGDPPTGLAIDEWHPTAAGYGLASHAIVQFMLADPDRWLAARP